MSERVEIVEVAPRDGLQNTARRLPPDVIAAFICKLRKAGFERMEVGAFVAPQKVPAMAATAQVVDTVRSGERPGDMALVANERGLDDALAHGMKAVAVFTAASDAFATANIGMDVATSLERFAPLVARARDHGLFVRGYISTITHCPYVGRIAPSAVAPAADALGAMGCSEVALGETLGKATPSQIAAVTEAVARVLPMDALAIHCHDTHGMGIANVHEAVRMGVRSVDASAGGLGGCPFAPGASGNVASEDVVYLLNGEGFETGIDMPALLAATRYCAEHLCLTPQSRVFSASVAAQL